MRTSKKVLLALAVALPLLFVGLLQAQANDASGDRAAASESNGVATQELGQRKAHRQAEATEDYWTANRMRNAKPMKATAVVEEADLQADPVSEIAGEPQFVPGWAPGSGPQPGAKASSEAVDQYDSAPQHGTKPTNPLSGPYGPFQRWTWFGRYLTYPTSTIGKLFGTLNGGDYVCSASVIQKNTVITAGHCVSDGTQTFATNLLFCPSYNAANGINPQRGCWAWAGVVTSGAWHNNGDQDYDYAAIITSTVGTTINDNIGDVTGWLGRYANFSSSQAEMIFGYAVAAPFPGNQIITTAATEWYDHDFVAGNQVSKVVGNDMTPGASGGPWILGWGHATAETADTDANNGTDPGGPAVNGVNSHKRCLTSCGTPPTATTGTFWQEMTSPPFLNTGAGDESEDIILQAFGSGGT